MLADLSLKKCSINDVVLLSRIGIQSYREHYMHLWTDNVHAEWYMDLSFSEESLLQQMKEPAAHFF
ncbi:MAG TPA: hypothetical protein VGO09_09995 [Flavisolibacter sp.]|nr:hypothetical protein [Flavisolibacter sp.]